ncbi:glycosyl transferase, group 1 [Caballeronia arvi]|uniref:Glycosyl transferase, group 1 n=2 Tax=Caballeronia arvi TaxID=1777135 RepID=A0A158EPB3_9BURK|nr:glycosyl transferase, group 1 [Caballeronia arvi]
MGGIGRFAAEISEGVGLPHAELVGNPASPFDWLYLSVKLASRRSDVFFSPGYNYPLFYRGKGLLVVHDLIHVDVPSTYRTLKRIYCKTILASACRRASAVLTVSEFTKERVAEFTGICPQKIVVVGNGVSDAFSHAGPRFQLGNGTSYLLGISNGKIHKNNRNVIAGFMKANLGSKVKLLFVGSPSKEVSSYTASLGIEDRVRFMGRVSEDELASLYRGALALVFPSLYEGFGLPIVESMACGTPVITSNCTAMPEVAGEAAILVDPRSEDEIGMAIGRVSRDSELRRSMSDTGIERARIFKWGDVTKKVEAALMELNLPRDRKRGARDGRVSMPEDGNCA